MLSPVLSDDEQRERRARMRERWEHGIAFNRHCGITVRRWDPDGVELLLPYNEQFTTTDGILHGGVLAALIDSAACGAVAAGHDYNHGSRPTTVSMSVNYLSAARQQDVVATARCTKRGRTIQYADVEVLTLDGKVLVHGIVSVVATAQPARSS